MEIYGPDNSFFTWEAGGACTSCSYILPPLVESAPGYFETGHVVCQKCGAKVDLWDIVSRRAKVAGFMPWSLTSLGAANTVVNLEVETGKVYQIDIRDYGAPPEAKILSVSCGSSDCAQGLITALVWHHGGGSRRLHGTTAPMFAVPLGEGPTPRAGKIGLSVVWIRKEDSDGWLYLLNAFDAATDGEFGPALVFAHSAIEVSLTPIVSKRLRQHSSRENVSQFITDSLKFAHTVNVMLPNLCGLLNIPKMPDPIRGALNSLRSKRNRIIHNGVSEAKITREDVAEGLSAAVLGFEYVRYITPKLSADGAGQCIHQT